MNRLGYFFATAALTMACGSSSNNGGGSGSSGNTGSSTGGSSGNAGSSTGGSGGNAGSSTGGSSGNPGTGGAGGSMATPECTQASQCKLHSDCCNCIALGPNEKAPACNVNCMVDVCTQLGITSKDLACTAGSCNAGINCDPTVPTCKTLPPKCATGEVPSVRGQCWGPCVKATECSSVAGCPVCDKATSVCVGNDSKPPTTHCVPVPTLCSTQHDCACLANAVCQSPLTLCTHVGGTNEVDCTCMSC